MGEDLMASIDQYLEREAQPAGTPAAARATGWGNSAPLALAGFATTTFMLSMINANIVPAATTPVVFGVAFMFGGLAQLIAGIICFRNGNAFGGVLFSGFGAFWLAYYFTAANFLKLVPLLQVGHAVGLLLYGFGIFATIMLLASFRTSVIVVVTLVALAATLFVLGAGYYTATTGAIRTGGWMGIALAGLAFYVCLAELFEATYGRSLPLFPLAKK
jgi:succinate-acetate transporter protein